MTTLKTDFRDTVAVSIKDCFGPQARAVSFTAMPQSASTRSYYRISLTGDGPSSIVLMRLPENPFGSDEVTTEDVFRELPFCTMQKMLNHLAVPVPRIFADCTLEGFLLLEDLGHRTMLSAMDPAHPPQIESLYRQAIELLVKFQSAMVQSVANPAIDTRLVEQRSFDYELLRWELDHFKEWLLHKWSGASLSAAEEMAIEEAFDDIASRVVDMPYIPVHRDFQSTNLMVHDEELTLIDFQDALLGPVVYDVVSLLRDSYVSLDTGLLERLKRHYHQLAAPVIPIGDWAQFEAHFRVQTLQRKLKDAGRFVFIDRVRKNPAFLQYIEPTLAFVSDALKQSPEYRTLSHVLAGYVPQLA